MTKKENQNRKMMKNKYYTIAFLAVNILSFLFSKSDLTYRFVSVNNLLSHIFQKLTGITNGLVSVVIFIIIATIIFYFLFKLFSNKKVLLIIFLLISLLISMPILDANGV